MVEPLQPPPKKNPLHRTVSPTRPPESRSRAALGLTAAAANGRLALQCCADCEAYQYPPRDACYRCLGVNLPWKDIPPTGKLLAETTIRTSTKLYFRERAPWRTGSVQLAVGPVIICHLHADCRKHATVKLINRLDRSGQGVILALPTEDSPYMDDDAQLRVLTSNPKHRRVLITDARNSNSQAIARALLAAGASEVFVGEAENWLPNAHRADLQAIDGVSILPLDVTDSLSVQRLAAEIGGKCDILINNARFIRDGGVLSRSDTGFARQEMEVNYLGAMRLAQAFGPAMCARTSDGINSAVAWVNLLSVYCLSNRADYGCFTASHAAARSLALSMRAEFRASGLRVMNVYYGPTEDDWHQPLPPPKVQPAAIARSVVDGLQQGLEETCCGDVANDIYQRYQQNPLVLDRELQPAGDGP